MSIAPRFPRSRNSGFTLIEILIALVVLFIGIVGIIALFPIGIKSTKKSVQDTNAALIAESIHHAIIIAMRNASTTGAGTGAWIEHDGCPVQTAGTYINKAAYQLRLIDAGGNPLVAMLPAFDHHPSVPLAAGDYTSPGGGPEIFQLGRSVEPGGTDTILKSLEDIRGGTVGAPPSGITGSDVTIDYNQYFWDFFVGQVTDGGAPPARLPLYQFRIRVWRAYENNLAPEQWKRGETVPGDVPENMIQEFRVLVASNS